MISPEDDFVTNIIFVVMASFAFFVVVGLILMWLCCTYADGGIVGTKPYVAGGNYIKKMSNFCQSCHYDVNQKTGEEACPFNYLYWHYLIEHKDKLQSNQRLRMPYSTLKKMKPIQIKQIQADAKAFIKEIT